MGVLKAYCQLLHVCGTHVRIEYTSCLTTVQQRYLALLQAQGHAVLLAELQGLQGHVSRVLAQARLLLHACQLQGKLCHPAFLPAQLLLLLYHLWHAFTFKACC